MGPVLHADSADISSTDITKREFLPTDNTGFRGFCATAMWDLLSLGKGYETMRKIVLTFMVAMIAFSALCFEAIPKQSAKNLGATGGKEIKSGIVFVNGKYVPGPYKVERWGTGIRINGQFVTGQIVAWNDFVKTQPGAEKIETTIGGDSASSDDDAGDEPMDDGDSMDDLWGDDDDMGLDDLFDDEPKPKKAAAKKAPAKKKAAKKPTKKVTYKLKGEFAHNDQTKAMLKKINDFRSDIDRHLRLGGMICFGDRYSRVMMDKGPAMKLLDKLPELQQTSSSAEELAAGIRQLRMDFISRDLCREFYKNRVDYHNLQQLRKKLKTSKFEL